MPRENPNRLVNLWDMYQFYAHTLLNLFDELRDLEIELQKRFPASPSSQAEDNVTKKFLEHLEKMLTATDILQLSSSRKQVQRIVDAVIGKRVPGPNISPLLAELRIRIREDLEDHVYLCIPERDADRLFKRTTQGYETKVPSELMDAAIVARFPSASDDIEETFKCFVCDRYAASMFHLMRVVEVGVIALAKLVELDDPSPSWGAVLQYVEKVVLRTKYEDLSPAIRPHRALLVAILPQMQAIQRAWRNKFSHVNGKIIPTDTGVTEQVASEILVTVEAFMRQLASDLPAVA